MILNEVKLSVMIILANLGLIEGWKTRIGLLIFDLTFMNLYNFKLHNKEFVKSNFVLKTNPLQP